MAPRTQPNPQKVANILAWFHKTAQAHSIKDLEKILPQVSSISGMQVKDYLQVLSDDNKIRVEKIGSGNWYWSFPSDEKKAKDNDLSKAWEENAKASATVNELQAKSDEAEAARADEQDTLSEFGSDRKTLMAKHGELNREIDMLKTELRTYSAQDPVVVEAKSNDTLQFRLTADMHTDQIVGMEMYFKELFAGGDREAMLEMLRDLYKEEYDEDEQSLRKL